MTSGLCVVPHTAEKQITLISIHSFASFYCTALLDDVVSEFSLLQTVHVRV